MYEKPTHVDFLFQTEEVFYGGNIFKSFQGVFICPFGKESLHSVFFVRGTGKEDIFSMSEISAENEEPSLKDPVLRAESEIRAKMKSAASLVKNIVISPAEVQDLISLSWSKLLGNMTKDFETQTDSAGLSKDDNKLIHGDEEKQATMTIFSSMGQNAKLLMEVMQIFEEATEMMEKTDGISEDLRTCILDFKKTFEVLRELYKETLLLFEPVCQHFG